uniref:Uncharacterized protein n=1 Tax=Rhizophora mucronata TaxID=61149 RepID=A0A2P2IYP4_RHIMU
MLQRIPSQPSPHSLPSWITIFARFTTQFSFVFISLKGL